MFSALMISYTLIMVAINACLMYDMVKDAVEIFLYKYPNVKPARPDIKQTILRLILFILMSAMPILNILIAAFLIKYREEIIDQSVEIAYVNSLNKNTH